jgi:hypothetical protein
MDPTVVKSILLPSIQAVTYSLGLKMVVFFAQLTMVEPGRKSMQV